MRRVAILLVVAGMLLVACGAQSDTADDGESSTTETAAESATGDETDPPEEGTTVPPDPSDEATPEDKAPPSDEASPAGEGSGSPESVPPEEGDSVTGEVPTGLLDEVMEKAASASGEARQSISVIRAESVVWADGSLGCPEPGEAYTLAPVDGYWIVLEAGGEEFDYRASSADFFRRCTERLISGPTG